MKISQIKKGLLLVTIACGTLAVGCELIVDFDRTKILPDVPETSIPDAMPPDEGGADADAEVEATEAGDAEAGPESDADAVGDADADQ